jgi:hypothetical protein
MIRAAPMTRLIPDKRCDICGGLLAPANLFSLQLSQKTDPSADSEPPDYVCIECLRSYSWSENPPRLVMSA